MVKRSLDLKHLEAAEGASAKAAQEAQRALERARKKIQSKQDPLTALEYTLLYEDTIAAAKKGAELIERLGTRLAAAPEPVLMCWIAAEGHPARPIPSPPQRVVAIGVADGSPPCLASNTSWHIQTSGSIRWTAIVDGPPIKSFLGCFTRAPAGPMGTGRKDILPLHRMLSERLNPEAKTFLAVGEDEIFQVFKQKEKVQEPVFRFLHRLLSKSLAWKPNGQTYIERLTHEQGQALLAAERILPELRECLKTLFITGPRPEHTPGLKGQEIPHFLHSARETYQQAREVLSRCEAYTCQNDASRELDAINRTWLPSIPHPLDD